MRKKNFIYLIGIFLLTSCGINKGYEALHIYNYFKAKQKFEKELGKKAQSPAAYGLSIIYYRDDNPFHNMDSAYHYSLLAVESYNNVKEKRHAKWKENLGYTLKDAFIQRKKLGDTAYKKVVLTNTVEAYNYFLADYPWSKWVKKARGQRDSLAYDLTQKENTSLAYQSYLSKYPKSKWKDEAQKALYQAQYRETTSPGKTSTFVQFIHQFPNNPLVRDAKFQIYSIETKENTIPKYLAFIDQFPKSPFLKDAWKQLYRLSIANYTKATILNFQKQYPQFPFPHLIQKDLRLVGKELFLYYDNKKYGYIDTSGSIIIPAQFDYAAPFSDGLALVLVDHRYGYIDKEGELLIAPKFDDAFDFNHGRAIVVKEKKYGVIDVTGNFIIPPKFKDIGPFKNGLAYVENSKGYQYYTLDGTIAFSTIYDNAFSFKEGMAQVQLDNKTGYISKNGILLVSITQGNIRHFSDTLFLHIYRDSTCLISPHLQPVPHSCYKRIGNLEENRAMVVKKEHYGFINRKGKLIIPIEKPKFANFFQFGNFQNGHTLEYRGGLFGMMDSTGAKVLPAIFSGIGVYGSLIPVSKGKGWGYCNHKVQLKIDYQYDYAGPFVNGTAIVEKEGQYGVINLDGSPLIPIQYTRIERLQHGNFKVKKQNNYGLFSQKGEQLLPLEYHKIRKINNDFFQLINKEGISYYTLQKRQLITPHE